MEGARAPGARGKRYAKGRKVAESQGQYDTEAVLAMTPAELSREIKRLEQQMFEHAKNLEFEEAARTRDDLTTLKEQAFIDAS